jgi:16S rRNA (uracil1498-N3)-methyltransferase
LEDTIAQDSPRLFIEPGDTVWQPDADIALSPEHAHYLGVVLRLAEGAEVRPFNARDGEWLGRIGHIRKGRGQVHLRSRLREPAPPGGPTLVFSPLKRDATDLVIRMATELGVGRLAPVTTERTNTHRINPERWRAICIEAAEQCERLDIPQIDPLITLGAALDGWPSDVPLYAALERMTDPKTDLSAVPQGFAALIGPEGGFSPGEAARLERAAFVRPISLGQLVLRADTAACVTLGLLQARARAGTEGDTSGHSDLARLQAGFSANAHVQSR